MKHSTMIPLIQLFCDDTTYTVERICDIPPCTLSVLMESVSVIGSTEQKNTFGYDYAYEVHLWFVFFIGFATKYNTYLSEDDMSFLVGRLQKVKHYLHVRFGTRDRLLGNTQVLRYVPKGGVTIELNESQSTIVRIVHNTALNDLIAHISSGTPTMRKSERMKLYKDFYDSIHAVLERLWSYSGQQFLGDELENIKHRATEGLSIFKDYFIEDTCA